MRRLIPVLQVDGEALVKTRSFRPAHYLGDPLNTVRLFNELEVDEIAVIDLAGARSGRPPDLGFVAEVVSEAFMPVLVAGGIRSADTAIKLARCGVEKVGFGEALYSAPDEVSRAAASLGSQSVVAMIDYRRNWLGKPTCRHAYGEKSDSRTPVELAVHAVALGCGEVVLTSIDHDGAAKGYDAETLASVAAAIGIPLVALGGAGTWQHLRAVFEIPGVDAAAGGSVFTLEGARQAVLVKYPSWDLRLQIGLV